MRVTKDEALEVVEILKKTYPDAKPGLHFKNAFELLVATILSAQCTDKRVNMITEKLFKKYKSPFDLKDVDPLELEEEIRDCGLYRNKSRNIINTCKILCDKYGGTVPNDMEKLMELPGVGRKTANVVISNAFKQDAIAVDTHVFRVSNRIGLAESDDVLKTEQQLMDILPKNLWSLSHHILIYHGRNICIARKPKCDICPIKHICKFYKNFIKN
ncbi:endonuclease III [Thermoanaerobacterium xylanolyticum LX-11]|uniref:Endonuclease III n=1 Tax=Thermoanaerobacterium xylanolyticum (strain ATCC 49914 / DSM 7097 / LX-11) TaxID=858215 RepID=F6BJ16_THEXL|nr:endonuclease III [Thermoanaerobacterium xylanolyticum]AEF16848.1 endonuclease III [Thermoanaerobacterium xylanolyticum LX-11]